MSETIRIEVFETACAGIGTWLTGVQELWTRKKY